MDKPFNYFLALCLEAAHETNEIPNWNKNTELCKYYNIDCGFRVTEDDEFLSKSPLLVKQAVESPTNKVRSPERERERIKAIAQGPQFSGDTYIKHGKTYLKPKEDKTWKNPEIEERLSKPPEYWDNEKKKFLEMAKTGKINIKGLKYLVAAGFLTEQDIKEVDPIEDL